MSVAQAPAAGPADEARTRILFADDEAGTRTLMRAALRKLGFGVTLASDGREALDAFRQSPHTLVLLDVDMPELDGYAVCRALRREAGELLPIVMVTGLDDAQSVQRAYEAGATDYIVKPINWSILGHRVRHLLRNYEMQRELQLAEARSKRAENRIGQLADSLQQANVELRLANDELQRQAFEDPLCGLPNRALLNDRLQQALQRISSVQAPEESESPGRDAKLAVMFIDLDGFKPINDCFGHAAGDQVLRDVAKRLRAIVRESDVLARLGGDEFVALIESPEAGADAMRLARRIIDALKRPFLVRDQNLALSCSIGIVVYPDQERSADRLLACADAAMYAAKRVGGSACVVYDPASMSDGGPEQVLMQQALRESLEGGRLMLFYQPKVDSLHGRIHGLEALLRWKDDKFGMVPPVEFIPLAERFGLIGAIGNWVIEQACAQLASWMAQGLRTRIAINLSPHQLRQPDLVQRMDDALRKHCLHPAQLTCEITESAMMENSANERGTLDRIAALGVRLSIDDFGTGYSSLAHLRHIPARQLKIDRSFVVDLTASEDARAVVRAIVQLAHALRMEVVAEGVETEEQLRVLRELGCDVLQGFHIARPMPADAVPAWMSTRESARREGMDSSFDALPGEPTRA